MVALSTVALRTERTGCIRVAEASVAAAIAFLAILLAPAIGWGRIGFLLAGDAVRLTVSLLAGTKIARAVATLAILTFRVVLDPLLAAMVTVLLGGAYGAVFWVSLQYLRRIGKARVTANQGRYRAANEAMGGIKDLRLLGREAEMVRRYTKPSFRFARFQANTRVISSVPRYAIEAVAFGSVVAIVILLLAGGRTDTDILPALGLYAFAGYLLMPALQQVFAGAAQIRYSQGALDEVHAMVSKVDALGADPDAFADRSEIQPLPFEDAIRFEDVTYSYTGSAPVLQGLRLTIPKNASVSFVGATGAGKTTAVDLILGLFDPDQGTTSGDGTPLDETRMPHWQSRIGYVPQTSLRRATTPSLASAASVCRAGSASASALPGPCITIRTY